MLTSGRKKSVQDAPTANDHDCNGRKANQAHTDARPTKSERDSAENLIDGGDGVTIPPVVARIFSGDRSSPLTRWARWIVLFEG